MVFIFGEIWLNVGERKVSAVTLFSGMINLLGNNLRKCHNAKFSLLFLSGEEFAATLNCFPRCLDFSWMSFHLQKTLQILICLPYS